MKILKPWHLSLICLFLLLPVHAGGAASLETRLTAAEARARIAASGHLEDVMLVEPFDLSTLRLGAGKGDGLRIERVRFRGGLVMSGDPPALDLHFVDCTVDPDITWNGKRWSRGLWFEGSTLNGRLFIKDSEFLSGVRFHYTTILRKLLITRSHFHEEAEFLNGSFGKEGKTSASSLTYTVFSGPVRFRESVFPSGARFDFSRFEKEADFSRISIDGSASFQGVYFGGEAGFQKCVLGKAEFSTENHPAMFLGPVDFRQCQMQQAKFDYAEFKGLVSFVGARIEDELSFAHATFTDALTNLDQIRVGGQLILKGSYAPALQLRWSELENAILRSEPRSDVLEELKHRLQGLGRGEEVLNLEYHLCRSRFSERKSNSGISPVERIWFWIEEIVWGWPTGCGTRPGRILLIALMAWLALALPFMWGKLRLVNLPKGALERPLYEPVLGSELIPDCRLVEGWPSRVVAGASFTFTLMFKVGRSRLRYLEDSGEQPRSLFAPYLFALWTMGSVLLALLGLTLANSHPALRSLFGQIAL